MKSRRDMPLLMAIAVSAGAHLLLYPAAEHIHVHYGAGAEDTGRTPVQITLSMTDEASPAAPKRSAVPPAHPLPDPDDAMGKAEGKGAGAHDAKGEQPLLAPEADQDQGLLSRDPQASRVGRAPADSDAPLGENGRGGQRGGTQIANHASASAAPPDMPSPPDAPSRPERAMARAPNEPDLPTPLMVRAVRLPDPSPRDTPPADVTPPESKIESRGAAAPRQEKPREQVKLADQLAMKSPTDPDSLPVAQDVGETKPPTQSASAAPAIAGASPLKPAVAIAPRLPLPTAVVSAPPPIALDTSPAFSSSQTTPTVARPAPAAPTVSSLRPTAPTPPSRDAALIATGDGLAPGASHRQANPAQESDSESDPFSKEMSADILRDGRVEARHGRRVKTTRPHLDFSEVADLYELGDPKVVLRVSFDQTGKVYDAQVIHRSGSTDVDTTVKVMMFDWWFEPSHDKHGRPIPDSVVLTIRFR